MKTEPAFCGKIHVTTVKNEKWFWYDYKTSRKSDEKILELAKNICPDKFTCARQHISDEKGRILLSAVEDAANNKLNIPENPSFSVTYSKTYNPVKKRDSHSILLFCEEKINPKKIFSNDRTAIDIYI